MDAAKNSRITCESSSSGVHRLNGTLLNSSQLLRSVKDEELCQLENEIKKAYVLKALHAQLAEQEANRMAEDIQTRIANEIARYQADAANEEYNRKEESKRLQRTNELKTALTRQIDEKRVERSLIEEEEKEERQLLIQLDKIREEKETQEKMRNKEELAEQILLQGLVQSEIREIDKRKLEELEMKEAAKNQKYLDELDERAERLKKIKSDAQKKREEVIQKVANMLLDAQREREERRQLLIDMMVEEAKIDAELQEREAELLRKRKMQEYAEFLREQIRFDADCKRRFLEREKQFAEAIMAKIMESEQMERLSAQVRRRRQIEYRKELEQLMKERERARAEELAKLRLAFEEERLKEEAEREEAKKARMALLEQHIDNIADFMNRKLLYSEERGLVEKSSNKK